MLRFPALVIRPRCGGGDEHGEGAVEVEILRDSKGEPVMSRLTIEQRKHIEVPSWILRPGNQST